jgi:putative flippase GtrA
MIDRLLPDDGKRALLGQFVRYALTGGLTSIVNIGVYWWLRDGARLDPNVAWTIGFIAAVLVGYVTHSRWSFRGHGRRDNLAPLGLVPGATSGIANLGADPAGAGLHAGCDILAQSELGV